MVLKTQYNHINHLDKKLDEVTSSVKELEHKFEHFEARLENEFKSHQQIVGHKIESLEKKIETEINSIRKDVKNEINSAIINQTKWLIGSAGILIVSMKLLDIFVK